MATAEQLLDSGLAHVVAIVLGGVGAVALWTGTALDWGWFWIFYGIVWLTFLDLFEDDEWFWESMYGDGSEATERTERESEDEDSDEDPLAVLKRRYAEGAIDDEEFDERLDRLLETPDTLDELETERA
ncbi:SHOCT domain-containing protein [Halosimplex pelagicum]|uniref:SHOCT domain-containing protein n=1 Tax=Halosimplex pelagicum TaxID=869886 RepID=A0A7D5TF41_9EURY|nr:SHOCT domain-containing protein [Halosimplex pelagicum]QLH84215.1 SHOCT domain-containing protein [Halosimplex pelagicum]